MKVAYFLNPLVLTVAVVQVLHHVIVRARWKLLSFSYNAHPFGITPENVPMAVIALRFIHLTAPAVVNAYVVVRKIPDVVDDKVIVLTVSVRGYPVVDHHITRIQLVLFDLS